ncbi:hypothetical protein CYMTET_24983 [Cymbomonas tetramitiformis]|uniref:Uncharacterized protein n=1 Tax=Cymbomonas tetramitiformis TaxID=36881 RepID=A0AAE0FW84_9CHLO|nr:hypothetical protein CYMTET_24983 [Cymbomonas tetramitiformis]
MHHGLVLVTILHAARMTISSGGGICFGQGKVAQCDPDAVLCVAGDDVLRLYGADELSEAQIYLILVLYVLIWGILGCYAQINLVTWRRNIRRF